MLQTMIDIATRGAEVVRERYTKEIIAEYKSADDPVTAIDREVNELVCKGLAAAFPNVPIVAEESDPSTFDVRRTASACFFVDPLDGTRELLARNGEFAVMIGFAENGRAILGVVAAPATSRTFAGGRSIPSFEIAPNGSRQFLVGSHCTDPRAARVVLSRFRAGDDTQGLLARLGATDVRKVGSAGLKGVAVAANEADLYVQMGLAGKLWDACAPAAIAFGAGVQHVTMTGEEVNYQNDPLDLPGVIVANAKLLEAVLVQITR